MVDSHRSYIELFQLYLDRAQATIKKVGFLKVLEIEEYVAHGRRQIDQIRRRVLNDEKIPHAEKVFSIFEEHTEWICKGKAGVPQELGLKVCVVEDQHQFILHHRVMENETDDKVAVGVIENTKTDFPNLISCSFDKGFYTPYNRRKLSKLLKNVILAKKGRLSLIDKEIENSEDFVYGRRKHSGVESAINARGNHGLDRYRDHGIYGFKRYVALGILSRNIQTLGNIIQKQKFKSVTRNMKIRQTKERLKCPPAA